METSDFDKVRASVAQSCGSRVRLQLDRGRNKIDVQEGVIQEAYPSVFTILVRREETGSASEFQLHGYYYQRDSHAVVRGLRIKEFSECADVLFSWQPRELPFRLF